VHVCVCAHTYKSPSDLADKQANNQRATTTKPLRTAVALTWNDKLCLCSEYFAFEMASWTQTYTAWFNPTLHFNI